MTKILSLSRMQHANKQVLILRKKTDVQRKNKCCTCCLHLMSCSFCERIPPRYPFLCLAVSQQSLVLYIIYQYQLWEITSICEMRSMFWMKAVPVAFNNANCSTSPVFCTCLGWLEAAFPAAVEKGFE